MMHSVNSISHAPEYNRARQIAAYERRYLEVCNYSLTLPYTRQFVQNIFQLMIRSDFKRPNFSVQVSL